MRPRDVYLVVIALVVWGMIGVLGSAPISKLAVIFCLMALGAQACSATYWSYRWRKIAGDWQHAAHYTYERFTAIINEQDAQIRQLHEPWRN